MFNEQNKIESLFLKYAFIFGLLFVFLIPPFQTADEDSHFKKAYLVSTFKLLPELDSSNTSGNYYPKSLLEFENNNRYMIGHVNNKYNYTKYYHDFALAKNYDEKVFIQYSTLNTNPFLYFPQATSMFLLKIIAKILMLGNSHYLTPLAYMHAGRIGNLVFYLVLSYFTIKIIPFYKNVTALLLLMPMSLILAASLSYDSMVISVSIFFIALTLFFTFSDQIKTITKKELIILSLLSIVLIELKQVYYPIILLLFIIPKEKFSNLKTKIYQISLVIIVGIMSHLLWLIFMNLVAQPSNSTNNNNTSEQVHFIFSNPLQYMKVLLLTIKESYFFYVNSFVGNLGWLDTNFPFIFILLYLVLLVIIAVFDSSDRIRIDLIQKLLILIIVVSIFILVETSLYVIWTSIPEIGGVGHRVVSGVQGRYFIPFSLLIFALLYTVPKERLIFRKIQHKLYKIVPLFCLFSCILTLIIILLRYWVPAV